MFAAMGGFGPSFLQAQQQQTALPMARADLALKLAGLPAEQMKAIAEMGTAEGNLRRYGPATPALISNLNTIANDTSEPAPVRGWARMLANSGGTTEDILKQISAFPTLGAKLGELQARTGEEGARAGLIGAQTTTEAGKPLVQAADIGAKQATAGLAAARTKTEEQTRDVKAEELRARTALEDQRRIQIQEMTEAERQNWVARTDKLIADKQLDLARKATEEMKQKYPGAKVPEAKWIYHPNPDGTADTVLWTPAPGETELKAGWTTTAPKGAELKIAYGPGGATRMVMAGAGYDPTKALGTGWSLAKPDEIAAVLNRIVPGGGGPGGGSTDHATTGEGLPPGSHANPDGTWTTPDGKTYRPR
jgi:hypothetical protein